VIEKAMDRDNFMGSEEAREFGLIDTVVESRPEPVGEDAKK
jgi:ATP-dependent Clp protease protease subunit